VVAHREKETAAIDVHVEWSSNVCHAQVKGVLVQQAGRLTVRIQVQGF
jgi:hypothetical protein